MKDHESIHHYAAQLEGAKESFPFGEETLVFKIKDKMFLLLALDVNPPHINVKCDPEKAKQLREDFLVVQPGYHMNKKHWNTVICDGSVPDSMVKEWIRESYELVAGPAVKKKSVKKKGKKKKA